MKKQQAPVQAQLRKYLYQKAAHNKVPLSGTFELTPRCNMNCRMCYIRMSEAEMRARGREYTAEEWIEMGKACAKAVSYTHLTLPTTSRRQRQMCIRDSLAADWRGTIS